jgi:hypothetical protein
MSKRKRKKHTWGSIYNSAVARGDDHAYAAYLADEWEARTAQQTQQARRTDGRTERA